MMKLWKSVTVTAWVLLLLVLGMLVSLPFQFPGGIIYWDAIAKVVWPIPVICILLLMGLFINTRHLRMLIWGTGVVSVLLMVVGALFLYSGFILIAALIAMGLSVGMTTR